MLKSTVEEALNHQINQELNAFYTYLSMAAYFENESLPGFSAWMQHHADEEMAHAMRLYGFIHERRGRVILTAIGTPRAEWESPLNVLEDALEHEQRVTASIHHLVDLARKESDHATDSFLQWFVDEQVEEEAVVDEVLQKIKHLGDFTPGLYLLDRELAAEAPAPAPTGG